MSVLLETLIDGKKRKWVENTPEWSLVLSIATPAHSLPSWFTFSGSKWVAAGKKTSSRDYSEG